MSASAGVDGLIIDVPEQLTRARRATEAGLAAVAAVLWLVALRPVLLLGLWFLGGQVAWTHMIKLEGWDNTASFEQLAAAGAGLSLVALLWSRYNALRFRRNERRQRQVQAESAAVAGYFGLPPEAMERMRASAWLKVERPGRTEVVVTCADGAQFAGRHDPVGPAPARRVRATVQAP